MLYNVDSFGGGSGLEAGFQWVKEPCCRRSMASTVLNTISGVGKLEWRIGGFNGQPRRTSLLCVLMVVCVSLLT